MGASVSHTRLKAALHSKPKRKLTISGIVPTMTVENVKRQWTREKERLFVLIKENDNRRKR